MLSGTGEKGEEDGLRKEHVRLPCSSEHLGQPNAELQRSLPVGGVRQKRPAQDPLGALSPRGCPGNECPQLQCFALKSLRGLPQVQA